MQLAQGEYIAPEKVENAYSKAEFVKSSKSDFYYSDIRIDFGLSFIENKYFA